MGANVRVRRDDGAAGEVDALALCARDERREGWGEGLGRSESWRVGDWARAHHHVVPVAGDVFYPVEVLVVIEKNLYNNYMNTITV